MGRGYRQSWFWCITSPGLITIANASVEFTSISITSVNPRLAIDLTSRIMTDTLYCSQKLLWTLVWLSTFKKHSLNFACLLSLGFKNPVGARHGRVYILLIPALERPRQVGLLASGQPGLHNEFLFQERNKKNHIGATRASLFPESLMTLRGSIHSESSPWCRTVDRSCNPGEDHTALDGSHTKVFQSALGREQLCLMGVFVFSILIS